jgi:hypothetical protein
MEYSYVANSLLHINGGVALSTDRERGVATKREREVATKRQRGVYCPLDQWINGVELIRVITAQPIRISLGFCEHL